MDARSSDDVLPSAPPEPAGAPSPSQPPSPTCSQKQAEVRDLLAALNGRILEKFRSNLEDAFYALKMPSQDLDDDSQHYITTCQQSIRPDFEWIVSKLSALEPNRLPDWLARCIFITPNKKRRPIIPADDPSQIRRDIIPANELFQVYSAWCTLHEHFDFYSALTQLLISGLEAVSDRSTSEGKTFFDDTLISEVDDELYDEPA
ncbi:hypothetical protein ACQY0O_001462 [Thecaphora frezii]